ncbi:HAD-like domain-containing protein, partial [Chytridium lagenaria]
MGIVFDIDGVLIKGKKVLPEAVRALKKLKADRIPFIFLTNGGGVPEERRAVELSKKFDIEIPPEMVILSHSPMASLSNRFRDDNVLILGKDTCKDVALKYGFKRPILAEELMAWNPAMWSFRPLTPNTTVPTYAKLPSSPIAAILMFHDSIDWGRDLQVACDILRSDKGHVGTQATHPGDAQSVPIFFSNGDFIWSNEYPQTRFAQGAFRMALETLYKNLTGRNLDYTIYGKPERATYEFADKTLRNVAQKLYPDKPIDKLAKHVYMVGDNPASDIEGANRFGWRSVLVKTGVYAGGQHFAT